jgi:hypothetical protein
VFVDPAAQGPLLLSIESMADAIWPVSPPLQQVHVQSFDDGREVIFGVGMSGRGHWSASFTMVPELSCWIIEFACRSPLVPERLGSAYQLGPGWVESAGQWQWLGQSQVLTLEAIAPSIFRPADEHHLVLAPATVPTSAPATIQWAYRLKRSPVGA